MYSFKYTKQAMKDAKLLKRANLKEKAQKVLDQIAIDPFSPPTKKLSGDMDDYYSRRINLQHRLVFEIHEDIKVIKVLRMWSHYDD